MSGKRTERLLREKIFHLFILSTSIFFLLLTAVYSNPGAPEASVYWYASSLHWTFWPGLALASGGVLLSIVHKRRYLGLVSVLVPVFYLYSLPPLVHDMLPVFDVYHVIPPVLSIIETGTWNMNLITFPASHIYQATSVMVFNVEVMTYAKLFPTILAFSIVIFIFTIARMFSKKWAPVAPLVFLALNWYMEYHMARQGFSIMTWAAFWLALFLYIDKRNYRIGILAGLILFALVPAHPGMLIIVSFNIAALTLVTFISFRDQEEWKYFQPFVPILHVFAEAAAILYATVP
ncbi:MAG: hypothetical protein V5A88_09415, partial [Candidatus Thermoplasmatota archaeon]